MSSPLLLIVDDERTILELVAQVLIEEGYEVLMSGSGRAALELAHEWDPNLILLDLMMPEMNGWQVVGELKASARTRAIPILLLSARREIDKTARDLGVADFIAKPFEIDELLERVRTLLSQHTSRHPPGPSRTSAG